MLYYITDVWTDETIDVTTDYEKAVRICKAHDGSDVTTEADEVLYSNISLPF